MINKKTAKRIWGEIKKARKVLLALHVSPDQDSAASVLALDLVLRRLKKKTLLISFSQVPPRLLTLPRIEKVKVVDFGKIDLRPYNLFFALDSQRPSMITRSTYPEKFPRGFKIINIDHHRTNTRYGKINLIAPLSSTTEILYQLFNLWGIKIDKALAKLLLWGMVADSGCFQYSLTSPQTLRIAADLMEKGASLNQMVLENLRSYSLGTLKYWAKILENLKLDESGLFVWSKISAEERRELGIDTTEIEGAASLFAPVVSGTKFGIILNEETEGLVRGSLRSRADFDVSRLAATLGGGGHPQASGFTLAMSLSEAEKKVLEVARKAI